MSHMAEVQLRRSDVHLGRKTGQAVATALCGCIRGTAIGILATEQLLALLLLL